MCVATDGCDEYNTEMGVSNWMSLAGPEPMSDRVQFALQADDMWYD